MKTLARDSMQFVVDSQECNDCGPDHKHDVLVLASHCHPEAGVDVVFFGGKNTVTLHCHECKTKIVMIVVAESVSQ